MGWNHVPERRLEPTSALSRADGIIGMHDVTHYNGHRPHEARQQLPPTVDTAPPPITNLAARVRRPTILNGLISEYAQAA
jgi:hypothetical protein